MTQTPVGEFRQQVSCDLAAEACLADTSGTDQGDEAVGGGEAQDLAQLVVAADQFGNRLRQVRRRAGGAGTRTTVLATVCVSGSGTTVRISPVNW
jgi:hypothetical protein